MFTSLHSAAETDTNESHRQPNPSHLAIESTEYAVHTCCRKSMEEQLARERAAELNVLDLLKQSDRPIREVLDAFVYYRQLCQAAIFADFQNAERKELRLWLAHTEGKKYFHRALSNLRKSSNDRPVETRQLMKLYLEFIKQSQRHYREYIYKLSIAAGGIPELQAVAQRVKSEGSGESQQPFIPSGLHQQVLLSCHQTLVYLGDLSRYRASERLDKSPDFGPAIGYYDLACTLRPSSGLGHHQQAVVALEQRQHFRAVYHLYRAITVENPHPNAAQNLKLEFDKINAAWDQGELVQKGQPNDPEGPKSALIGWFVRLHSMCFKGEHFRGYDELECEVLTQLTNVVKQHPLEGTLTRMVLVNIAAQYTAGEQFQGDPTETHQTSFLYFFRFNLRTFSTLLRIFYDDLKARVLSLDDDEGGLSVKLTSTIRRILPCLRLYSNWLLPMVYMVVGLASDSVVRDAAEQFWPLYAKVVDLIAQTFPIWDLEDLPEVSYMLEEDVDTIDFKALHGVKTLKTWYSKHTALLKPRFTDRDLVRESSEGEMLERVKEFLVDGLYLANDDEQAPITLRGTRVSYGHESQLDKLISETVDRSASTQHPNPTVIKQRPKFTGHVATTTDDNVQSAMPAPTEDFNASSVTASRDAQLSRMVDDLVDDDDGNNPVTPPQHHTLNPAVVTNGELPRTLPDNTQDINAESKLVQYSNTPSGYPISSRSNVADPPPTEDTSPLIATTTRHDRLQSMSRLWDDAVSPSSPSFPQGLSIGKLGSPVPSFDHGHSRVNSASSIRSRTSQVATDYWSSLDAAVPRAPSDPSIAQQGYGVANSSIQSSNTVSPLLFGAGGGLWSTGPWAGFKNVSPTNGGHGS